MKEKKPAEIFIIISNKNLSSKLDSVWLCIKLTHCVC